VRSGEHLGILADRYGVPERTIARANNLSDADIILPGQRLVIPGIAHTSENVTNRDILSAMESGAEVGENLRPPLSEIYHQHTDYPTKTEKWIDVDLSEQRVVAYSGMTQVKSFIVSTGLAGTPTVQGEFRIWTKTPVQDLYGGNRAAGDFYYLEDVPWVQYFYEDYAFHGAYWHDHFGQPRSRGCVNMRSEDARWLYEWAGPSSEPDDNGWVFSSGGDPGTLVLVHE
jgi:lipoprotein-anchoring transpeptidase ErfK/SrfK